MTPSASPQSCSSEKRLLTPFQAEEAVAVAGLAVQGDRQQELDARQTALAEAA